MYKYFIGLCLILSLSNCKTASKESSNAAAHDSAATHTPAERVTLTAAQLKNLPITTTALQQYSFSSTIKLNGKIDVPPQNLVSVSEPLGGFLKQTNLLPGMHVSKGDVLAVMQDQQYVALQQEYLIAKTKIELALAEYNRQKALQTDNAGTLKALQQAENELKLLRITQKALSEKLKLIHINADDLTPNNISNQIKVYSSINGFVNKVNVNIGKYVNASEVMFELINPSDIHLNIRVFEKDLKYLSIGQSVKAFTNNNIEKKYDCEIILISKNILEDGSTDVHCHFENYDKSLLPGMYMNAEIPVNSIKNWGLPESCVVHFEGKDYVFVAEANNKFVLTPVTVEQTNNGYVSIANATYLQQKNIVQQGAYGLLMKVKNGED